MNVSKEYDVIIVGAGPAGSACAISLKESGLKVALIDKATFPRDKICGDALSPDILNQLHKIDPKLREKLDNLDQKIQCRGIVISAPNGEATSVSMPQTKTNKTNFGYVVKRQDFDNLMFDWVQSNTATDIFQGCAVKSIEDLGHSIVVSTTQGELKTKMLVGADGAHSIVNKQLMGVTEIDRDHHAGALRMYYKGVTGFQQGNIELHFIKDILPGYLWIFPLSNNEANVGIGMLSSHISKENVNLKKMLKEVIEEHPLFKDRFVNAEPLESVKGYGLPLGAKKRPISGNRFLLTGDAASIIDPSSGEGVGNAIRSGRFAAQHILENVSSDFSKAVNVNYDKKLYKSILTELKISKTFQKTHIFPWMLNSLIRKINKSHSFKKYFTEKAAVFDVEDPLFLTKFFFRFLLGR